MDDAHGAGRLGATRIGGASAARWRGWRWQDETAVWGRGGGRWGVTCGERVHPPFPGTLCSNVPAPPSAFSTPSHSEKQLLVVSRDYLRKELLRSSQIPEIEENLVLKNQKERGGFHLLVENSMKVLVLLADFGVSERRSCISWMTWLGIILPGELNHTCGWCNHTFGWWQYQPGRIKLKIPYFSGNGWNCLISKKLYNNSSTEFFDLCRHSAL